MDRSSTTEGQDRHASQINPTFHAVHAGRCGHILVHYLVDTGCRLDGRHLQALRHPRRRLFGQRSIERHSSTEERIGVEQAQEQVGVGNGRSGSSLPVAGRARLGTSRLGSDLQQAKLVNTGEAPATGTDLDEVHGRHRYWEAGALLEPIHACHLEGVHEARLELFNQSRLGCRAAHVEGQETLLAEASGVPPCGEGPGCRARLDEADRRLCGVLGRDHTAIGEHHQDGAPEALRHQPLPQLVQVGTDHRHRGCIAGCRDHPRVLADLGGDRRRHTDWQPQLLT